MPLRTAADQVPYRLAAFPAVNQAFWTTCSQLACHSGGCRAHSPYSMPLAHFFQISPALGYSQVYPEKSRSGCRSSPMCGSSWKAARTLPR